MAAVSSGALVVWSSASAARTWGAQLAHVGAMALGYGAWGYLAQACLVSVALTVALHVLVAVVPASKITSHERFSSTGTGNVGERVRDTAQRVRRHLSTDQGDIVRAFDELVRGALSVEASDIHVSPAGEGLRITYRVHGSLYEVGQFDRSVAPRLVTRVKVLARLDTHIRSTPQDGRLVTTLGKTIVEARVSTLPTEHGERVVLRLVRGGRAVPELDALGFSDEVAAGIRDLLSRPQGIFFMTAPVGSGKTTTLYAALKHISDSRGQMTNLVTLEDPIELELPFATQTQMHPRSGMTFAGTLRSVLRQDPNVLMVGEIRDRETADIAMQAGLTGHLILTTVHGDSAAGPFARIVDMGIEPFIIASATLGCVSQRLVRTLCTACRKTAPADPLIVTRFTELGVKLPDATFYEPVGCDYCEATGFTGRRPIAELLVVDEELRRAVHASRPTRELYDLALRKGMTSLLNDGLQRASNGETSLAEVVRVAG